MRKLLILTLLALTSVFGALSAQNYDFEVDGIYYAYRKDWDCSYEYWQKINGEVEVVKAGYSGVVVIPDTVMYDGTSYRVSKIVDSAFYGCSGLTSVTIPESLNRIESNVFSGCSGLSVVWNARHCETKYRYNCNSVNSAHSIAYYRPFSGAHLSTITFGEKVEFIPDYLCFGSSGLTSVTIPESVTSIGSYAFEGCSGLTSVTIPEGVAEIGGEVFSGCGLTSVVWNARHCLTEYWRYIPEEVYPHFWCDYHKPFDGNPLTSITFGDKVEFIPDYLCYGQSGLTSVTIPEGVTGIGGSAFQNCSGLTSVEWNARECADFGSPHSASGSHDYNYTPSYAPPFSDLSCTAITFGSEVKRIPGYLCYGWSSLTSVTIPDSVTSVKRSVFEGCTGLTSVEWNAKHCEVYSSPFKDASLNTITFGDKVEEIPAALCYGCSSLTSVTIGESVATIGYSAFEDCSSLTSVTIPESVTLIGAEAFYGCTSISGPLYNSKIFAYMPQDYSGDYAIPSGIQSIAATAFGNCSGLASVTIPASVRSIGEYAFYGCSGLTSVKSLAETPPTCEYDWIFGGDDYYLTIPLYVPAGSKPWYVVALGWRHFINIEEFEANIYTVTVQPNEASMGTVTGGGEYKEGEQAMLAAIPYQGYYFARWDDGNTNNPRILTVSGDTTITAIFAKNGDTPNENLEADNFRVYAQGRTICLSEDRGAVQVYNIAGQSVYNGHATIIPVPQSGVYVVAVGPQRFKVLVR